MMRSVGTSWTSCSETPGSSWSRGGYGSADGPHFGVGTGLDFGDASIGNIGDGAAQDFTAVVTVVNTAARLQAHAEAGEVVLSAPHARLLPNRWVCPSDSRSRGSGSHSTPGGCGSSASPRR